MKQSSIEWLLNELKLYANPLIKDEYRLNIPKNKMVTIIEQYKQMHKEEVTSFTADWSIQYKYEDGKSINEYYNETFNK